MKRRKIIVNLLILIVAVFFLYKAFSYLTLLNAEKESRSIYASMREKKAGSETKGRKVDKKAGSDKKGPGRDIDLSALKSINSEIVAWLASDDLSIDYPLLKAGDNSKYLDRAANGEENYYGSIFMDYRNQDLKDPFIMIYGHMTENALMFGPLNTFKDEKRQGQIKYFDLFTEDGSYRCRPILASIVDGRSLIDPRDYKDFSKRKEFFEELRKNAVFDSAYKLEEDDRLINLVTCSYERHNVRLFVVLKIED